MLFRSPKLYSLFAIDLPLAAIRQVATAFYDGEDAMKVSFVTL